MAATLPMAKDALDAAVRMYPNEMIEPPGARVVERSGRG